MGNAISYAAWTQSYCITAPTLTEKNLPDQAGKVHIVTGGYAGVGEQLAKILYSKGAKVYFAGRRESKAKTAIERVKSACPNASGEIVFLKLDLADLLSIKASIEEFLAKESRLDVLVNNAGVMFPPKGTKTAQDHDLQFGTNCLGPYLFTKYLHPVMKQTAATSPPNTVRVIWASSLGIQLLSLAGGVQFDTSGKLKDINQTVNYAQTKVGNILLAIKTQELLKDAGVVSHGAALVSWMMYPAVYGAYTELWSGWSPYVTIDKGITYVMPWGRDGTAIVRNDILQAIEKHDLVDTFWKYCEGETKQYA
ncbi:short-chain alcohol dehydrogenase [Exophiala xenobiotica]|uniref:Short-chain alcohol dehydrogenase n=1 Tax=Lithohypha guttulata TaxID=1690604 RepID=A0ABR0K6D1_9EURO|nr:short-chain alcohol dehydrogenase [Lithohypha guttulata]KAK5313997.1 short-chain alcohol dehydrogenase [Exophiala xenobiotica]